MPLKPAEPVKITFDLPEEAVKKLTDLAKVGDAALRQLGILSLQVEGGKVRAALFNRIQCSPMNNNVTHRIENILN